MEQRDQTSEKQPDEVRSPPSADVKKEEGELLKVQPSLTCKRKDHFFYQVSGTEVKCRNCPIGYVIGPETELKRGHIFIHGEFII